MLELKNNKHNTYYRSYINSQWSYFKLLFTSYLKRDLAKKQ